MKTRPKTIDEYLNALSGDKRAALQELRKTIQAAAPQAEECISYSLPAFRMGKMLVAFGATDKHCAFYPMSGETIAAHQHELARYDTSKGTIRFHEEHPLPAALVRKMVKARIAENAAGKKPAAERKSKSPTGTTRARKSASKRVAGATGSGSGADPAVAAYLSDLTHPLKPVVEELREVVLAASPEIREGIKWNAPSFRTSDWFATLNLRARGGEERVWLILHLGAKAKGISAKGRVKDPAGLLEWLAKDRCLVTFVDLADVKAKRGALQDIVREWIECLPR